MNEKAKADGIYGLGFVGRMDFRRSRSGDRLWSKELKAGSFERVWRLERASPTWRANMEYARRIDAVARRGALRAARARDRRACRVVEIKLNEPIARSDGDARIEIVVGKVVLRLERGAAPTRIAEIVTALGRDA